MWRQLETSGDKWRQSGDKWRQVETKWRQSGDKWRQSGDKWRQVETSGDKWRQMENRFYLGVQKIYIYYGFLLNRYWSKNVLIYMRDKRRSGDKAVVVVRACSTQWGVFCFI
jgi:hypothetical protein